jgi:hypothetical protein
MRGRTVLFVALAVATALVAAYLGWSTGTPKAAGNPSAPSKGATRHEASGSAPAALPSPSKGSATKASAPKASPTKVSPPKMSPPKMSPPKVSPPKATPPKGCLTADAKPAAYVTPPDEEPATRTENEPATDPASDAAAQAAEGDDEVRFGPMAEGSHGHVDTNIAPDRQALTTGFDNLEVEVGNGKLTDCDATRSYTMTIPLTGGGHRSVLRFHVQGYAFVAKGVTARLTVRGNGRTTARDFPAGTDDSFLQTVELPATPGTTYRLETVVKLHQDPDTSRTAGYLNVTAIDVEIV